MIAILKVTVLCTGVWGSQIAFQRAVKGFDRPASGISVVAVDAARGRGTEFSEEYKCDVAGATDSSASAAESVLFTAVFGADVDLVWHHTSPIRCGDSILSKFGGTAETDTAVIAVVVDFASVIGMVVIKLHKEKGGRILNSLLVPFPNASAALAAGEYADPVDVDQCERSPPMPRCARFQIYDTISFCPAQRLGSRRR